MPRSLTENDCDLGAISRVLVVKPSSLGDIVHTLPAVAALKRANPALHVRWVANPEWLPLLDGHPDIDEAVVFPRREFGRVLAPARFWKWSRRLRDPTPPDLALDFQGLLRSAAIARRSGAGLVAGLGDAREGARILYHRVAEVDARAHAVDRYLCLPRALGAPGDGEAEFRLPPGTLPDAVLPERFVLLHPFARGGGKSLAPADVGRICRALSPIPVVIVGRGLAVGARWPENATDLLNGTTLAELIGVMRRAVFVVSVDSGPMHIAAALGPRLLAIHGWSDPAKVGPYRPDAWVWKDGRIDRARDWRRDGPRGEAEANSGAMPTADAIDRIAEFVRAMVAGDSAG